MLLPPRHAGYHAVSGEHWHCIILAALAVSVIFCRYRLCPGSIPREYTGGLGSLRGPRKCPGGPGSVRGAPVVSGGPRQCLGGRDRVREAAAESGRPQQCRRGCGSVREAPEVSGGMRQCPGGRSSVRGAAAVSGGPRQHILQGDREGDRTWRLFILTDRAVSKSLECAEGEA